VQFSRNRNDLRFEEATTRSFVLPTNYGYAAVNMFGSKTSQSYKFSRLLSLKPDDAPDADSILATQLFRRTR